MKTPSLFQAGQNSRPPIHPSDVACGSLIHLRPQLSGSGGRFDQTQEAISILRAHRVATGFGEITPKSSAIAVDSFHASKSQARAVAQRIRGIEKDAGQFSSDETSRGHSLNAAVVLQGEEAIREFQKGLLGEIHHVRERIETGPIASTNNFRRVQAAAISALALQYFLLHDFSQSGFPDMTAICCLGALMTYEPHAILRQMFERERRFIRTLKMSEDFLADKEKTQAWTYLSGNYTLHRGLIQAILSPSVSLFKLDEKLGDQESRDMDGPVIRNYLRPLTESGFKGDFKTLFQKRTLPRWTLPAWVGIDQFLKRDEKTGEPVLVYFVRAQGEMPRYSAKQRSLYEQLDLSLDLDLTPVPVARDSILKREDPT